MATLDVLTLPEAKLAISNNAGASNDDLLGSYITGVSAYLDEICGPIVTRTITAELHNGGGEMIILKQFPVVAISALSEYAGTSQTVLTQQTIGTTPQNGYTVDPASGVIRRTTTGRPWRFTAGAENVTVTYTAGRFANTGAVAEKFKRAAGFVLANIYRREHGMGANLEMMSGLTFLLPNAAAALLYGEMRTVR